jgi:hypothetical protein
VPTADVVPRLREVEGGLMIDLIEISDDDLSFILAAEKQLSSIQRPQFVARVREILSGVREIGPGVNKTVRQALQGAFPLARLAHHARVSAA